MFPSNGPAGDWPAHIRRFRRQHAMKQAALAELIGVDQATVSRWEAGRIVPPIRIQHRLRDLIGRAVPDDALLRHWIDTAVNSMMLSDPSFVITAASAAFERQHGIRRGTARGLSTTPTHTAESLVNRNAALEHGFYRGDVASFSIVSRSNSLCGRYRNIGVKVVWTPVRRDDGVLWLRAERVVLDEMQFVRAQAENGGPLRIVTMDDLVSAGG